MRELKVLAVVVFFSLAVYWLVEPFAHGQLHKHVDSENFEYKDLPAMTKTGDVARGQELVMGAGACVGCHSIEAAGMPAMMDPVTAAASYGVNPPDLSDSGAIYDEKFLAALIKDPASALKVSHKFDPAAGKMHPMTQFYGAGGDIDQEIADMVAYLKSIATKEITPKVAYDNACGRCHSIDYMNGTQIGERVSHKKKQDELVFEKNLLDYQDSLTKYMGKLPPDLSMYAGSRGQVFLETLIENPQNRLDGTAMPRVGLTAEATEKVITYMRDSYDPKREERNSVGINVMIYLVFFALFAYLWKRKIWSELH